MEIWKFPLLADDAPISMPRGARILSLALQRGEPHVWALADPEQPKVLRRLRVIGTGMRLGDVANSVFVGTFVLDRLGLVFHVFDAGEEQSK